MMLQANDNQKNASVVILITNKIDFKPKNITRDKDGHYIMINGTNHQKDIIFINIYASKIGATKYIKQLLTDLKEEIAGNTILVGSLVPHLHQCIDHPKSTRKQ
uniref:Uncharacterized protein n=1 Tax=Equus caballus TaxID=9796 RepID=A0A9L0RDI9_HORSE